MDPVEAEPGEGLPPATRRGRPRRRPRAAGGCRRRRRWCRRRTWPGHRAAPRTAAHISDVPAVPWRSTTGSPSPATGTPGSDRGGCRRRSPRAARPQLVGQSSSSIVAEAGLGLGAPPLAEVRPFLHGTSVPSKGCRSEWIIDVRRRQITDAVCRITVKGGLAAATFREVAAEAGVSVRLVQYYFGTKDELLLATQRHVAERATARSLAFLARRRGHAAGRPARHPRVVHPHRRRAAARTC